MDFTEEQIVAIGGKPWAHPGGGADRVYLNVEVWGPLIGLEIHRYGSGNISSATLGGDAISNQRAAELTRARVYWSEGHLHVWDMPTYLEHELRQAIAGAVPAPKLDPPLTVAGLILELCALLHREGNVPVLVDPRSNGGRGPVSVRGVQPADTKDGPVAVITD